MRDTVAEMAERAQLISQEAGSKVAAAMKDVISAAAGITGFAIESARDLVQYMVRRGQMTPEEADKLMREAEAAHDRRPASEKGKPTASKIAADRAAAAKAEAAARAAAQLAAIPPYRQAFVDRPATPVVTAAMSAAPAKVPAKAAARPASPAREKAVKAAPASKPHKAAATKTKPAKPAAKATQRDHSKASKPAPKKKAKR